MTGIKLWNEENEAVRERYELSMGRMNMIKTEETVTEPYRSYFLFIADFARMLEELWTALESGGDKNWGLDQWQRWNHRLYEDILPDHYPESFGNPVYSVEKLGRGYGQILSFCYTELRGSIAYVHEGRLKELTESLELMLSLYHQFEEAYEEFGKPPQEALLRDTVYWHMSDYCAQTQERRLREMLDPGMSFARDIIMNSDLGRQDYLYRFGEYISDTELSVSRFLSGLPQEMIQNMADTYTQGYERGFAVMGRDLSKKQTVAVRWELGFEQVVRRSIENFCNMGLEPLLVRAPVQSLLKQPGRKAGYHGTSPNRQWEYDHRFDSALYLDKRFEQRRLDTLRSAYESCRELAAAYAGPAVMETFGRKAFEPANHKEACRWSKKQEEMALAYSNEAAGIANGYIPGDETSFTIIAWPVPEIGPDFEAIFEDTIRINTLDYDAYKEVQQTLIDALDTGEWAEITGRDGNETSLKVSLARLENPETQTVFENCVADVNIPLGEVFTSPRLENTSGLLHVKQVYIGDVLFQNLRLWFENGMVTDYSCDNYSSPQDGRDLVKQVILKNHETLPMGEFAIGTNTTAYAMAEKYGIIERLPILIVEKMGPHFAVGDTCYSWSEDSPVFNPNGKEIIARDNEVSALRREDAAKAYFSCHTDITIPYRELDCIEVVRADGGRETLIAGGRFVLPGTEMLNRALDEPGESA